MWQTFKDECADNNYGNNIKTTVTRGSKTNCQISCGNVEHGAIRQIKSSNINKQQQQHFDSQFYGSRLSANVSHERHSNMHSSAVVADSTAVIVNIGGCDQSAETTTTTTANRQQLRSTNVRVRRTSSGASYSEVAVGAHRRERKISSSSQTSKYGNNQKRTGSPQVSPQPNRHKPPARHLRGEQQQTSATQNVNACSHRREQSPKPSESPRDLARRRHKAPQAAVAGGGSTNKLRQHSIETTENASHNKKSRHHQTQQHLHRQRDSSISSSTASSCNGSCSSDDGDTNTTSTSSGEPNLPYPGFPEVALKYLTQDTRPRNWCLMMITNPYPFFTNYTKL